MRSVDIFATIADIIGLSSANYGRRGRSLLPLMQDKQLEELPVYMESATNSIKTLTENTIGIRTSEFKYFRDRNDSAKNIHLYDLKNDPFEENNIAANKTDIVEKMEKMLVEILKGESFLYRETKKLSKEEIKKARKTLSKLGYI